MLFFDGRQVVEVVHHHPQGLFDPLIGQVCRPVYLLDQGAVGQVKVGHPVCDLAVSFGLEKVGGAQ